VAAESGRVGWGAIQFGIDGLQHTRQITINIAIPKPENAKASAGKSVVAYSIFCCMTFKIVLAAVDLDDKTLL